MTELSIELIGQNREVLHRIVRYRNQGSSYNFVVVVDAFHCEVVVARPLAANGGADSKSHGARVGDSGTQEREIQNTSALSI